MRRSARAALAVVVEGPSQGVTGSACGKEAWALALCSFDGTARA
ncbi:MAG TPA: hypothetical protein VLB86_08580 [Gaiellaceae bacterium]|nr:hypothetical protein [Gaiellaceae bacterium]